MKKRLFAAKLSTNQSLDKQTPFKWNLSILQVCVKQCCISMLAETFIAKGDVTNVAEFISIVVIYSYIGFCYSRYAFSQVLLIFGMQSLFVVHDMTGEGKLFLAK